MWERCVYCMLCIIQYKSYTMRRVYGHRSWTAMVGKSYGKNYEEQEKEKQSEYEWAKHGILFIFILSFGIADVLLFYFT